MLCFYTLFEIDKSGGLVDQSPEVYICILATSMILEVPSFRFLVVFVVATALPVEGRRF